MPRREPAPADRRRLRPTAARLRHGCVEHRRAPSATPVTPGAAAGRHAGRAPPPKRRRRPSGSAAAAGSSASCAASTCGRSSSCRSSSTRACTSPCSPPWPRCGGSCTRAATSRSSSRSSTTWASRTSRFYGNQMFRACAAIGAVGVMAGTVITVLATALVNVISEMTGGIRLIVIEEDVDRDRRWRRRSGSHPGGPTHYRRLPLGAIAQLVRAHP